MSQFAENINSENDKGNSNATVDNKDILSNVAYICKSSSLITEALQKGFDITQMPNGDIIVTEVKTVNSQYSWDPIKQKMVKISNNIS